MALAPLLYNITFDSQTRILYFWDKAGHEIYHCEIPSHAPALPTVSYIGQLCVANKAQLAMNANEVAALRKWDMNESVPYNSSYKYSASKYSSNGSQEYSAADKFKIQATPQGGSSILAVKNISGAAKVFYYIYAYSCDSPDATVITVYDSSNNPYNAFKYTSDGTDYYYVLDGVQTDWTDDLSSIGYKLQQIYTAWVNSNKSQGQVSSYINSYMYNNSGSFYLYEYNTEYSIISIDGDRTSEYIQKLELHNTLVADPYRLGLKVKAGIDGLVVNLTYIEFTMTPTT